MGKRREKYFFIKRLYVHQFWSRKVGDDKLQKNVV